MKTNLTDEELAKKGFNQNIFNEYFYKIYEKDHPVFIDVRTREITHDSYLDPKIQKELKLEGE